MNYGTGFVETEAFLHACDDVDIDSGNIDATTEYLVGLFSPAELDRLEEAADTLIEACARARRRITGDG